MSRGEDQRDRLKAVVQSILATGTSVPDVIDMFASVLHALNFSEEAELIFDVATASREST